MPVNRGFSRSVWPFGVVVLCTSQLGRSHTAGVEDRFHVTGIIAAGEAGSLAVLYDDKEQRNHFLHVGDELPMEPGLKIEAIDRRHVIISAGGEQIYLRPEAFVAESSEGRAGGERRDGIKFRDGGVLTNISEPALSANSDGELPQQTDGDNAVSAEGLEEDSRRYFKAPAVAPMSMGYWHSPPSIHAQTLNNLGSAMEYQAKLADPDDPED